MGRVTQCCCPDNDTDVSQNSDKKELVCYGIGNFATSLIARYQLALFLIFRDELKVSTMTCDTTVDLVEDQLK